MAMSAVSRQTLFGSTRPKLQSLLANLHGLSLEQDRAGAHPSPRHFLAGQKQLPATAELQKKLADDHFRDKFVALDEDKASAVYAILRAKGATRIFEAGTSFGVSTLYLLAAMRDNLAVQPSAATSSLGLPPRVYGTEQEAEKIKIAYQHMQQGFTDGGEAIDIDREGQLQILQGDILEEIPKQKFEKASLDALLLDIWAELALPILKLLEPALKPGAVMFVDNVATKNSPYKDLYAYIDDPANGWTNIVLPYTNGFGMAVKGAGK